MEKRYHRFYKIWSKVLNFSEDIFTRTNQGDKEDDGANASFMKVCRIVVLYEKRDDENFTLTTEGLETMVLRAMDNLHSIR